MHNGSVTKTEQTFFKPQACRQHTSLNPSVGTFLSASPPSPLHASVPTWHLPTQRPVWTSHVDPAAVEWEVWKIITWLTPSRHSSGFEGYNAWAHLTWRVPEQQRRGSHLTCHITRMCDIAMTRGLLWDRQDGGGQAEGDGCSWKIPNYSQPALETIPGTLKVPVWLYGCPRCLMTQLQNSSHSLGKKRADKGRNMFSSRWHLLTRYEHEVTDGVFSNSLIYQYVWYIGKLHTHEDR